MKKRIVISSMLCAALLCSGAYAANQSAAPAVSSAPAADTASADTAPATMPAEAIPYSIGIRATVTDLSTQDGTTFLEVLPEDGVPIILLVSDSTILLDNQNAVPIGLEDIKPGDTIYAYHDLMMTMSIPGQTPALAILTNLGEGAIATLHTPEQIRMNGDTAEALCDNGSIYIRTSDDTVFLPYRTRQIVNASDLRMGQPFLAWYDTVMESYPAQATASRIMILPTDLDTHSLDLLIDGDMVIDAKMQDGTVIVPARLTAETLGLKVGYRREGNTAYVTISDDTNELSMTIGEDAYRCRAIPNGQDGTPQAFGAAPFTAPYMDGADVTWMSAEAFQLLGYDVSLNHSTLHITKP